MNRGFTSLLCALLLVLMLAADCQNNEQLTNQYIEQESSEKSNHNNQSNGGFHIATGKWWEPSRPYNVTTNDWDGDGLIGGGPGSGIFENSQLEFIDSLGFDAALIGTSLMKTGEPGRALAHLLQRGMI